MGDVKALLQSVRSKTGTLVERKKAFEASCIEMQVEINRMLKDLVTAIQNGETTGDRITDFVISRYQGTSPELEQPYRDLEGRMQGHVGELILFITRKEEPETSSGFPRVESIDYVLAEKLYVGILRGDKFILNSSGSWTIQTGPHVLYSRGAHMIPCAGDICSLGVDDLDFVNLGKLTEGKVKGRFSRAKAQVKLEIKIGTAEIDEWLELDGFAYASIFPRVLELLSNSPSNEG